MKRIGVVVGLALGLIGAPAMADDTLPVALIIIKEPKPQVHHRVVHHRPKLVAIQKSAEIKPIIVQVPVPKEKPTWLGLTAAEWAATGVGLWAAIITTIAVFIAFYTLRAIKNVPEEIQKQDWNRQDTEEKRSILRSMLATYGVPQNVEWSSSLNNIPVIFKDDEDVKEARRKYIHFASNMPLDDAPTEIKKNHKELMDNSQMELICSIANLLGHPITPNELKTEGYFARGMIERENALHCSHLATIQIAAALTVQAEHITGIKPPYPTPILWQPPKNTDLSE